MRSRNRAATRSLVIHVGALDAGEDGSAARAGFVVGRSVGSAVVRNRVLRQLRHLMLPRLADVPEGLGVVVRALPGAAVADPRDLAGDLDDGLRRCLARQGQRPSPVPAVSQ
jgi:ribonuclease P protein component